MRPRRAVTAYPAYLFDVDGTLAYPERAVPGAAEALAALKARGRSVLAVTNNSSLGRHEIAERFRRYGLPLDDGEVFSALAATAQLVAHERPGASVHVFGNPGLRAEVERCGLRPVDDGDVDYVIVGNNVGVTFAWLTAAMRALLGGARFVAVNADRMYIGPDGGLIPGAGVWVAGLERAVGRPPDVVVGKPSVTLLLQAAESIGRPPADCLYVGDNPEADIGGAHAASMDALLVLTGVAAGADECPEPPEHVLPSVADLARLMAASA
jgi:HAD superfamily hydrolase (TIGR01450 family)